MRIPLNYGKRYIDMFYNIYPQLAEELKIPLVPFLLQDVALNKQLMQSDGLHPGALAQPVITETVWTHLRPMLK
jgi:acyl-CoA thioesterase-1